jgi:tetratricopeptide (TPR) repeat protein
MGEKTATFELIQSAVNQGRLHEYQSTFHRLRSLAKKDGDIEAMALLGKVLRTQENEPEALEWLEKATSPPTGHLDFAGSGEALCIMGLIHLKRGNRAAAESAFKKAALDLDEPLAYFNLAQLQENSSETQKVYLLKAASSGMLEACHKLGMLELKKIAEAGKKPKSLEDYGMAREWLQVAATDGFGWSILNMAMICKKVGQEENALAWLEKANAKEEEVASQARELALQWAREADEAKRWD